MAPYKSVRTYKKSDTSALLKNTTFKSKITKKLTLKKLPAEEIKYLKNDSFQVQTDDPFDNILKGEVFNNVHFKKNAFVQDSSESDISKTCSVPSISISRIVTPKKTSRPRRTVKKVQKQCSPLPKVETTLDKPVDYSLSREFENKNISINISSTVASAALENSNANESSFEPIFTRSFKSRYEKKLLSAKITNMASSTPLVPDLGKKIINDTISPISNNKVNIYSLKDISNIIPHEIIQATPKKTSAGKFKRTKNINYSENEKSSSLIDTANSTDIIEATEDLNSYFKAPSKKRDSIDNKLTNSMLQSNINYISYPPSKPCTRSHTKRMRNIKGKSKNNTDGSNSIIEISSRMEYELGNDLKLKNNSDPQQQDIIILDSIASKSREVADSSRILEDMSLSPEVNSTKTNTSSVHVDPSNIPQELNRLSISDASESQLTSISNKDSEITNFENSEMHNSSIPMQSGSKNNNSSGALFDSNLSETSKLYMPTNVHLTNLNIDEIIANNSENLSRSSSTQEQCSIENSVQTDQPSFGKNIENLLNITKLNLPCKVYMNVPDVPVQNISVSDFNKRDGIKASTNELSAWSDLSNTSSTPIPKVTTRRKSKIKSNERIENSIQIGVTRSRSYDSAFNTTKPFLPRTLSLKLDNFSIQGISYYSKTDNILKDTSTGEFSETININNSINFRNRDVCNDSNYSQLLQNSLPFYTPISKVTTRRRSKIKSDEHVSLISNEVNHHKLSLQIEKISTNRNVNVVETTSDEECDISELALMSPTLNEQNYCDIENSAQITLGRSKDREHNITKLNLPCHVCLNQGNFLHKNTLDCSNIDNISIETPINELSETTNSISLRNQVVCKDLNYSELCSTSLPFCTPVSKITTRCRNNLRSVEHVPLIGDKQCNMTSTSISNESNDNFDMSHHGGSRLLSKISLKPGKWRRSMSLFRQSLKVEVENKNCVKPTDEHEIDECHEGNVCSCAKGSKKPNVPLSTSNTSLKSQHSRRLSVKIVPISEKTPVRGRPMTVLETYAASKTSGYGSKHAEVLEEILEDLSSKKKPKHLDFLHEKSDGAELTAKDIIWQRCGQKDTLPFSVCFNDAVLKDARKIGEGVYGEVFLIQKPNQETSVIKIIPIEGKTIVNGEKQKKYDEILSEIVIAQELSNLRNGRMNGTTSFCELKKMSCVKGKYPQKLIDLWELFDDIHGSENDNPRIFKSDQIYIVLELSNSGKDMEAYVFNNSQQAYSVFRQMVCALAVSEAAVQFEHRDMHWGNILILPVDKAKKITYNINSNKVEIPSHGVEVTIIDFTMSRITCDGVCIYNDLADDPELFTADGDYQFEIYRLMQKHTGNSWEKFSPYTNVLWMHYILDKLISSLRYKYTLSRLHRDFIHKLRKEFRTILNYESIQKYVEDRYINMDRPDSDHIITKHL